MKARSPIDDARKHGLDDLRRAVENCSRAIAKRHLRLVDQVSDETTDALSRLPRRLLGRDCTILRGTMDALALKCAFHDTKVHHKLLPAERGDAAIFEKAEEARTDCLGSRIMPGVARNIYEMLLDRYRKPHFAKPIQAAETLIGDALAIMIRHKIAFPDHRLLAPMLVSKWNNFIEEKAGSLLNDLESVLNDQESYGRLVIRIIETFRDRDLSAVTVSQESLPEPIAVWQTEEEPGPIGGGDKSLRQAGGTKFAEDAAIGDEPISGEGERAKAFGYDAAGKQAEPDRDDLSEPSRRSTGSGRSKSKAYRVFTRRYDETVRATELLDRTQLNRLRTQVDLELVNLNRIVGRLANRLERSLLAKQPILWRGDVEGGWLDVSRLARVIANPLDGSYYMEPYVGPVRDTVITLLLDNSGSMRGRPSMIVAVCVDILARTLERCGVKVEILGFTTRSWRGGRAKADWIAAGCPSRPGRLNEVRHIIYKEADAPWRQARQNLGLLSLHGFHKENVDGEALAWAHGRLSTRVEGRKILMMISDGAPVDETTLSVDNGTGNYLEKHLHDVVREIQQAQMVELLAIGIGYDVSPFYPQSVMIKEVDELGPTMISELARLLHPMRTRAKRWTIPQERKGVS
jgi:cobaltochelatase CobT